MTKAERLLKQLGLDYEVLIEDEAFKISPLDFTTKVKIILVIGEEYSMFIFKDEQIQKECKFKEYSSITSTYSYLYTYDKNNFKNKKKWQLMKTRLEN